MRLARYEVVAAIGLAGCLLSDRGQAFGMGQAFARGNKKVGGRGELLHLSDWEASAAKGWVSVAIGEPQEFWLGKP
jgi:hypothetical protein